METTKIELKKLKQGDKFYYIRGYEIAWYTYLCNHPRHKSYHILLNQVEDPVRVYKTHLQDILDNSYSTYVEAIPALSAKHELSAKKLRRHQQQEQKMNKTEQKDTNRHLCGSCKLVFATCPAKEIKFGDGLGNDNVVECDSYDKEGNK